MTTCCLSTRSRRRPRWRHFARDLRSIPCRLATTADISPMHGTRSAWWRPLFLPSSQLIDQTVLEARVRGEHGLTVIGLRRGRVALGHGLLDEKLRSATRCCWSDSGPTSSAFTSKAGTWWCSTCRPNWTTRCQMRAEHSTRWLFLLLVIGLMVSGLSERAGCPDRMSPHGYAGLCRSEQRLSVDQLEKSHIDRRDDAVLSRTATNRWSRSGR